MISPHLKLRTQIKTETSSSIRPTQYGDSTKKSSYIRQKLTKGKKKYEQIKSSLTKCCENHSKRKEECTFDPRSKNKCSNFRSFDKFLEDQQNFQKNKQSNLKKFKTQTQRIQGDIYSSQPSIDSLSKRICTLTKYDQQNVIDRLCQKKILEQIRDDEDLFSPKILPKSKSLKRTQNVSELLHEDALRRHARKQFIEHQRSLKVQQVPTINRNTEDLISKKIYSQFCDLMPESETQIPIVMAWSIFSELFNINIDPNKSDEEATMCIEMMKCLCQEDGEMVTRQKFWEFIEVILKKNQASISLLSNKEAEEIIDTFGNLYSKRISKGRAPKQPQNLSFMPEILKNSDRYATVHRNKMLKNAQQYLETGNVSLNIPNQAKIQDIFMIEHFMRKASNEKKKLDLESEQMKKCTFKPQIIDTPKYLNKKYPPKINSCSKISYKTNLKSPTYEHKKSLTSSLEATMIQSHVLTQSLHSNSLHRSVIQNKIQMRKSLEKPEYEVKNAEKSILRMAVARQQRQLSNEMRSRGYGKVQNWAQDIKKKKQRVTKQHKKLKGYAYSKINLCV